MFGARCTLCGSRLNSDGICTECGLNNRRNSDKKYYINQNSCENEPLSHTHTNWYNENRVEEKPKKEDPREFWKETHPVSDVQKAYDKEKRKQKKGITAKQTGCLIWVIVLAVYVIELLVGLVN